MDLVYDPTIFGDNVGWDIGVFVVFGVEPAVGLCVVDGVGVLLDILVGIDVWLFVGYGVGV